MSEPVSAVSSNHAALCAKLAEFVFDELEKKFGAERALRMILAVAALLIGAYARAKREQTPAVVKAVGLLAQGFDEVVHRYEGEES